MNQPSHFLPAVVPPGWQRYRFVANSVELAIDLRNNHDPSVESLHTAAALGENDDLLQCVSNWMGEDFDWRHHSPAAGSISLDFTLVSRTNPELRIGLAFKDSVESLPPFPENLNDVAYLNTHTRMVNVCLTQLKLNQSDKKKLMPGSCLLLPETFNSNCNISILNAQSRLLLIDAVLDMNQLTLLHSGATAQHPKPHTDSQVTRVVLRESIEIDFQQWSIGSTRVLRSLVGQTVVVEIDGLQSYNATLIRVGNGLAALLDEPLWT